MSVQKPMTVLLSKTIKKMGIRLNGSKLTSCVPGLARSSFGDSSCLFRQSWGVTGGFGKTMSNFSTLSSSSFQKKINSCDFINDERNSLGFSDKMFGKYEKVTPQKVLPKLAVPDKINFPDYCYCDFGLPLKRPSKKPSILKEEHIIRMREPCQLAKHVLTMVIKELKPGVTTDQLDRYAHNILTKNDAYPSALGYKHFPKSICTSVNNVACHGIPDSRKLIDGDIVTIDVMAYKNGFHGDCAATGLVGSVDPLGLRLVNAAEACMNAGITECGPNRPISAIGKAIEACAADYKVNVLHAFTGHGVGRNIHEKPDVFNYYRKEQDNELMKPGMVFTVEPIVTQGMDVVMVLSDGWTSVTVDGARAAQFENTILITQNAFEIMTDAGGFTFYDWK